MLHLLAPLVLFLQVAHVALDLLLALPNAILDLALHFFRLFFFHPVDLGQALLVIVSLHSGKFALLSYASILALFLDHFGFLDVVLQLVLCVLLKLFSLLHIDHIEVLRVRDRLILPLLQLLLL